MSEPIKYSAGTVTAYGAAVRGGYTGTYEQWCQDMANLGDNVTEVREKAAQAAQSASDAAGSASAAADSAGSAAGSAGNAAGSATAASGSASSAAGSASAAAASATEAGNAKTAAETAASHYPRITNGYWYVWEVSTGAYVNTNVKAEGEDGATGPAGKSAYESAQDGGYSGTEAQFETDLAGVSGKQAIINASGILKGSGNGQVSPAVAGTDYLEPGALAPYRTAEAQDVIDTGKLNKPETAGTADQILGLDNQLNPTWQDRDRVATVTGTTPTITAIPGVRYVCGEVTTLDITLPASGIVDVVFESGTTPTVLTVTPPSGVTLKWANGFDPTALEANTTYEINVADGLGVAASWT